MTCQWIVRSFRLKIGKTQTEFGTLLNKSLPTIQRWEGPVPPSGRNLLELAELAEEYQQSTTAGMFRDFFEKEWGIKLTRIFEGESVYALEEDTLP